MYAPTFSYQSLETMDTKMLDFSRNTRLKERKRNLVLERKHLRKERISHSSVNLSGWNWVSRQSCCAGAHLDPDCLLMHVLSPLFKHKPHVKQKTSGVRGQSSPSHHFFFSSLCDHIELSFFSPFYFQFNWLIKNWQIGLPCQVCQTFKNSGLYLIETYFLLFVSKSLPVLFKDTWLCLEF